MKKYMTLFLAAVMAVSLMACAKTGGDTTVTTLEVPSTTEKPEENTTVPAEPEIPDIADPVTPDVYSHYGLRFVLDGDYTLRPGERDSWYYDPEFIYFYSENISGVIRCRWSPTDTQTSKQFANWWGGRVEQINDDLYYSLTEIDEEQQIHALYRYSDYGWEFELTGDNEQAMVEILRSIMIAPDDLCRPGEQSVVVGNLSMELPAFFWEVSREDNALQLAATGGCLISAKAVAGDDQELARSAQMEMDKSWEQTALYDFGLMSCVLAWKVGEDVSMIRSFRSGWQVDIAGHDLEYMLQLLAAMSVEDAKSEPKLVFTVNEWMSFWQLGEYICPSEEWEGKYTVDVLGLGTQVSLEMYGLEVNSFTAFGRTQEAYFGLDEGMIDLGFIPYDGGFIMNSFDSQNWLILPEGNYPVPEKEACRTSLYVNDDGQLLYSRAANYVYYCEQTCILDFVSSRDEFFDEDGTAAIVDGELVLTPLVSTTVSDYYDLDAQFEEFQGYGVYLEYESVDDYFAWKNSAMPD